MAYVYSFILYGSAWFAFVALLCLAVTSLPVWRRRFPQAWLVNAGLLLASGGVLLISTGIFFYAYRLRMQFQPQTQQQTSMLEPTSDTAAEPSAETVPMVSLHITSNPPGAAIFIAGQRIGRSPLTWQVRQGSVVTYALVADPSAYQPFVGRTLAESNRNLEVWMDRRGSLEQEVWLEPDIELLVSNLKEDDNGNNSNVTSASNASSGEELRLERRVIAGNLHNHSEQDYLYVLVSFLLFDTQERPVGVSYDLLYTIAAQNSYSFRAPVTRAQAVDYRLNSIVALNAP